MAETPTAPTSVPSAIPVLNFAIDRGGTFTDIYAQSPDGQVRLMKLLSVDPENYPDAPREGIRRLIERELGTKLSPDQPLDPKLIGWIRMGTTVATNALLERKGEPIALVVTKGFRDILEIGNQSRPNIFDLQVKCPEVLYSDVVEVEERVVLQQSCCQIESLIKRPVKESLTGEHIEVWQEVDLNRLKGDLQRVLDSGVRSLAVALLHSYAYPDHEKQVEKLAKDMGFEYVTLSSQIMPMVKIVPRGFTVCADGYLTPHIQRYIHGFASGFKGGVKDLNVLFMQSDGGLTPVDKFSGSRAILSGPAGGVCGYALTASSEVGTDMPLIGFDMGGTSTDVSRYHNGFEHTYEATTAGITIQAPQLDINTVAAGGGSKLFFRSGLFVVGPESAGALPGPTCYRNGGPLTVTDANVCLGRVLPQYFPKIFGPKQCQSLDKEAALNSFESLSREINHFLENSSQGSSSKSKFSLEEVAMGFIRVANEAMCRPIRAITEGKGFDSSRHVLASFGGAGGQHACAVARALGIKTVFIHRFAGILSAFGMALADIVHEKQVPAAITYDEKNFGLIDEHFSQLREHCESQLMAQGFKSESLSFEMYLNLRYEKTDFAIMCQPKKVKASTSSLCSEGDFKAAFVERYKREFGFTLEDRDIIIDDIRVRGVGKSGVRLSHELNKADKDPLPDSTVDCYFEKQGFLKTPVYLLDQLFAGHRLDGPAIIIDPNSTTLIEPDCTASITDTGNIRIDIEKEGETGIGSALDPIQLSIFSHRFMSIAEQAGRVLQRTSISTNIKERLDFSCALFGPDGGLVSNAPHIPVHLGAMQKAVQFQLELLGDSLRPGDVLLSNHPCAGGSHLPDLTVITPVFYEGHAKPVFFVASRGHHADIGGITPGSMPPHSTRLDQEGATFISFKLVKEGHFQEVLVTEHLSLPGKVPGSSGTRALNDNISDLQAQIAANQKAATLVGQLIDYYGLNAVQSYMRYIQENAEVAVRDMLKEICKKRNSEQLFAEDVMDDGTEIKLRVDIDGQKGSAVFDFTGTGLEVYGNLNTPEAVVFSAIIYCLRCMVGHDVPLNQGCLAPVKVIIPKGSIISPSKEAAVVGGNVLTSQRVVDVVLKAFQVCAASQGCMNNITFGDEGSGYYETVAGGAGAGPHWRGRSGVHSHMTNTRITDPEIIEKRYPVIVKKFHLNPGTGGRGEYCGGDGVVRELLFRKPLVLSVLTERRVFSPYGMAGGECGRKGRNILVFKNGNRVVNLGSKTSVTVEAGDVFHLETPGGGGYGTPLPLPPPATL